MVGGERTFLIVLIFISVFKYSFSVSSDTNPDIVNIFEQPNKTSSFDHLTIDQSSGAIFIGAVNRLYRLDLDLNVLQSVVTGPKNESLECSDSKFSAVKVDTLINNVNKVLLIDNTTNNLIFCSTACQGSCSLRKLGDISVSDDVNTEVVANDNIVAFIGPGLLNSPVMYVAISNTRHTSDQEKTPAISSRSLDSGEIFTFVKKDDGEGVITFASTKKLNQYQTEYVYGFSSGRFSYFLAIQKILNEASITKLIRICHNDSLSASYTEIPLTCTGEDGVEYNLVDAAYVGKVDLVLAKKLEIDTEDDVLFASFHLNNYLLSNVSCLCLFSLKVIDKSFKETIKRCFDGTETTILNHIAGARKCSKGTDKNEIEENFCGSKIHRYIGGSIPLESNSVYNFSASITALASTPVGNLTAVFAGTSDGHIKKIVILESLKGIQYEDIIIQEGSAVQKDLLLDSQLMFLYVMTERRVSKARLHKCGLYSGSCQMCMDTKDPFCGWCSSKYKCSLRAECEDSFVNDLSWVSFGSPGCPVVTDRIPDAIQRGLSVNLDMSIENLPLFAQNVTCVFSVSNITQMTLGTRSEDRVNCQSPKFDDIILFPIGLHNYTMQMSINVDSGPDIASTQFTLYDCNSYSSCTECTVTFPCDWCLHEHRCSHISSSQYCANNTFQAVVKYPLSEATKDSGNVISCPSITAVSGKPNQISVLSGSNDSIEVSVEWINLISQIAESFHCQLDNGIPIVAHLLEENIIRCDSSEMITESAYKKMNLSVMWNGSNKFDNKYGISILIFNCKFMAKSCGECLETEEKYGCGWCQSTNSCEIKAHCNVEDDYIWLTGLNICPDPEIYSFYPLTGVIGAETSISIQGINFRQNASTVIVAGEICNTVESLHSKSVQINCTVRMNSASEGPITIKIANYSSHSKINFSFVSPSIESLYPEFGPKSGKTLLTISGHYLNAGNDIQSFINEKQCEILNISNTGEEVICIGVPWDGVDATGTLTMKYDGRVFEYMNKFRYVSDPVINCTHLMPKGTVSGGINIQVAGENLDSVLNPQIYVYLNDSSYIGECIILSNTCMICKSPPFKVEEELNLNYPLALKYGFIMDEVETVKNISSMFGPFLLFPDPIYDEFNESIKYLKSEYLTLNGQNLDFACSEADIKVTIEQNECNITSLSHNQLICLLPAEDELTVNGEDTFDVMVKVGHRVFILGKISYSSYLTKFIIAGVAFSISIVVFLFMLFFFVYRKKSTESVKNLKNMEAQMDKLELRVAAECKEAFAELQTEIFDLTGDLSEGIPFLDYQAYAVNVLFPNVEDHNILLWTTPEFTRYDRGLNMFQQLVMNKTFLLHLIDTLESNKYFSMQDRVNTASYLMIIFQNEMQYCSDIVKILLAKLIEKSVNGKCHPKLLLRRTESVAEKMLSSWLTFLLYKFLKECAGEPLYKLFRSVKGQIDKGPVDSITSESKYSLVEGKLLRESVDFQTMSVYASFPLSIKDTALIEMETENINVKVLDCDTISQVKEKCLDAVYKGKSFSKRPNKDDFDLEWKTGSRVRLILHDVDDTNEIENEWKKLNTLKHYKVPNGGHVVLVSRHDSVDKFSTIKSINYDTLRQKELNSGESTSKLWHLLKHDDAVSKEGERSNKMVSEIYLTRLLATKGTLQKFVDDLFKTIFNAHNKNSPLPLAIKYLFDFLDDQALQHDIKDPEVVHTWKNNSLPLRFWVNLIKNPNFIFDIHKSNAVDACLSVIAQTFMDSCSTANHILGKDSPSAKLLYAKDIPVYKEWVEQYYVAIRNMDEVSDQNMNAMLWEESQSHAVEFNRNYALQKLYEYVLKYSDQLRVILEEDQLSQQQKLATKLNHLHDLMESDIAV